MLNFAECHDRKHRKHQHRKIKSLKHKKHKVYIKTENQDLIITSNDSVAKSVHEDETDTKKTQKDPIMSALNLLELQARARAIRSQLLNEIICDDNSLTGQSTKGNSVKLENISASSDSPNSVVILSPERDVVEIDGSSHSEEEQSIKKTLVHEEKCDKEPNSNGVSKDVISTTLENNHAKENSVNKNNTANSTVVEDDNDVLIMNEDDDILI